MDVGWRRLLLLAGAGIVAALGLTLIGLWAWDAWTYRWFRDPEVGIAIKYPRRWTMVPHPQGSLVGFVSPKDTALDLFQENVSIAVVPVPDTLTLEQHRASSIEQMKFMYNDPTIEEARVRFGDHDGLRMTFYGRGEDAVIMIFWTFLYRGTAYNITFAGEMEAYKKPAVRRTVDTMIASFRTGF